MDGTLQLKLSLLRGESPCPMDMDAFGRLSPLELKTQTRSAFSDRLAMAMMDMIASGQLRPGCQLPPERQIARAVSASRVCVRAALARLKGDGYLVAVQGSGTRVVLAGQDSRMASLIQANRENLDDLGAFVGFLDGCILQRLITVASDAELMALSDYLVSPAAEAAETDATLRTLLAERAGSLTLLLVTRRLERGIRNLFGTSVAARLDGLAEALRRRDLDGALAVLTGSGGVPQGGPDLGMADAEGVLRGLLVGSPEQLGTRLAREIAGMIATGSAISNGRLASERRLADMFGVSRASVREALTLLKTVGTVVADERWGTRVAGACGDATPLAPSDIGELRMMSRLRGFLEVWAARRAAVHAGPKDDADLRRILSEMRRPNLTARRRIDMDLRLHLTIGRAAGNAVNLYITEILRDLMTAYFDHSLSDPLIGGGREAMLLRHHGAIVAAILARDPATAEASMAEHCTAFSSLYADRTVVSSL